MTNPGSGTVYTETVVFSPPEAYVNDVPYQLAIIQLDSGRRLTGRIAGDRAQIGDHVAFARVSQQRSVFPKDRMTPARHPFPR